MKKYIWLMAVLVLLCTWCSAETDINKFDINSRSVYMVNLNNDRVMLSHNADKKMEPASLTKIMTALVVLESCEDIEDENLNDDILDIDDENDDWDDSSDDESIDDDLFIDIE